MNKQAKIWMSKELRHILYNRTPVLYYNIFNHVLSFQIMKVRNTQNKLLSMKPFFIIILLCISYISHAANDVPDTIAERVKACTICHQDENQSKRGVYYPRISGKPFDYLFNQLQNFRDGRRYYQPMAILLENMSDDYLLEIAHYFASLQLPYPPPEQISMRADEIKLAKNLIYSGDPERNIPACRACHGKALMGTVPSIPGLLGLPHAYLSAQFGAWRNGGIMRGQKPDCMSEIAKQLTDDEANALAKWLATRPVTGKSDPASAMLPELARRCDHIVQNYSIEK